MDAPLVKHVTRVEAAPADSGDSFRFYLDAECVREYVDLVCDRDPRGLSETGLRAVGVVVPGESARTQLRYYRTELRPRLLLEGGRGAADLEFLDEETGDHERAELNDDGDIAALVTTKSDGLLQRREYELDVESGQYELVTFTEERAGVCETALLFEGGKLNKEIAHNRRRASEGLAKSHEHVSKLFNRTVTFHFD